MNYGEIMPLIEARKYFILHAPRQTGKTSALFALVDELNATGRYRALYINVEGAQAHRDDIEAAMRSILSVIGERAKRALQDPFPNDFRAHALQSGSDALRTMLSEWCSRSPLPICLMIDEIDAMVGDSLLSVLRQLRAGYPFRPNAFPQTIVLCGVRDLRDYRIHGTREIITGGSAFNIKAESLRLGNFTDAEIRRLYQLHTTETGQVFEEAVFPLVWDLTRGQPWLVNALAFEACFRLQQDRTQPITADIIQDAKESLILRRDTHIDQLGDKLSEERVRRVIQPIMLGDAQFDTAMYNDDTQYVIDLGLIERVKGAGLQISNAIYREIIPRELSYQTQLALEIAQSELWYIAPDGSLDMAKLLEGFQQFFRENADAWLDRFTYREAGPHLLMQAFLQRIVNGGGRIDREYSLGRRRTDLLVVWKHPAGVQRSVVEIKIQHKSLDATIAEGLPQTADYMDRAGTSDGHLVIFNRNANATWEEKIFRRQESSGAHTITVWGM
ncbi:MAG: ATP-binding protein [Acidobacteria bacterium]|nr:ATP-binding protein [Acidobacteriota bacterium]